MYRLAITTAALALTMTACGSGSPDSVDGVIDTLGCKTVTSENETLAKVEKICTLDNGKRVWIVEAQDKVSMDAFVSMAAGFGMEHAPLTDTLYVGTKDYATLRQIAPKLNLQVNAS